MTAPAPSPEIAAYVERVVAAAPPLTVEQTSLLRRVFAGGDDIDRT